MGKLMELREMLEMMAVRLMEEYLIAMDNKA